MTQAARADSTVGNNLELNKGDNFIFLVDVSGSMGTKDCPGGMSRIEFLKEKTIQFVGEASKYDPDGVDVIPFGHNVNAPIKADAANAATVIGALQANESATQTHLAIRKA